MLSSILARHGLRFATTPAVIARTASLLKKLSD
jgi:hypothetical protein